MKKRTPAMINITLLNQNQENSIQWKFINSFIQGINGENKRKVREK